MGLITCIISKTFPKEALNVLEHNPRRTTHQGRESDESLSWCARFLFKFLSAYCDILLCFDRLLRLLWFLFYNTQLESIPSSLMMNIS